MRAPKVWRWEGSTLSGPEQFPNEGSFLSNRGIYATRLWERQLKLMSAKSYERCPGKLLLVVARTANLISDLRV